MNKYNKLVITELGNQQTSDVVKTGINRNYNFDVASTITGKNTSINYYTKEEAFGLKSFQEDLKKLEALASFCSVQHWIDNSVDIAREIVQSLAGK